MSPFSSPTVRILTRANADSAPGTSPDGRHRPSQGTSPEDLVNHLIARLTPLDIRQLFICNKDVFYATYRGWSDSKRDYVADFLSQNYASDKDGVWQALYGTCEPVTAPSPWGSRSGGR